MLPEGERTRQAFRSNQAGLTPESTGVAQRRERVEPPPRDETAGLDDPAAPRSFGALR